MKSRMIRVIEKVRLEGVCLSDNLKEWSYRGTIIKSHLEPDVCPGYSISGGLKMDSDDKIDGIDEGVGENLIMDDEEDNLLDDSDSVEDEIS